MPDPYDKGFPPVSARNARVLILGSLPGKRSLAAVQYYAQPQNAFWRIMGELLGAGPDVEYASRLRKLIQHRIALWDVVGAGVRPGSLDASIVRSSIELNDFASFFAIHGHVERILFNGKTAAELFERRIRPGLAAAARQIPVTVLPSTSPAHAAMSYSQKLARWRSALADALSDDG